MSTKTLMTMEQFLLLPDDESYRYELWQGELVEVGETTVRHNWVREKLLFLLTLFLQQTRLGEVFAETGIQFDSNTLARPDIVYWDAEHFAPIDWDQSPAEVIPQLLVEIISPSNSLKTMLRNAEYYLRAGVQVVWIVNRDPFEIHVFEKGQAKRVLRAGDLLEAPSVLPGFSTAVANLVPPVR
jgi:Uma2 family endonuclease